MVVYLNKNIAAFVGNFHNYNAHAPYPMAIAAPAVVTGTAQFNDDTKVIYGGIDAMAIRSSEMKLGGI